MQAQHLMQIRHQDKDKTQEVGPVKLGSQKPEQPHIKSISSTNQQPSSGDWETF